ncbi:ATP-binding cassette, subfamily B [Lachnospiraceae bacterium XBB1006]|nr:ATP-binding cassette, subfamily B [Lachnospiraceae bacterium XBB1006]
MKNFKFLFRFVKPHMIRYIIGIVVLAGVDYASLFIPAYTGELTDGLTNHTLDLAGVRHLILMVVLCGMTMAVGRFLWRYFLFVTARKVEFDIRNQLFAHLETMDVEYYNEHKTGGLMAHFTNDLNAVRMALGPAVISAFDATVMALMVIFQMVRTVDLRLTSITVIPMFVIMFGELLFGKWIHRVYKKMQKAFEDLSDFVQEGISGIRVIKAFVQEQQQKKSFDEKNKETRRKNLHFMKWIAIEEPGVGFFIGLSSLCNLLIGGRMAILGDITLGDFVAFTQYITMLIWPMLAAGEAINMFSRGTASVSRLNEIFEAKSEIIEETPVEEEAGQKPFAGKLAFKDLTFIHKGHLEPTIKHLNLTVKPGTTLAVIGKTGSGKSTLVNLLLHLYRVNKGMIFFDDRDIREIPLTELRRNIAYVPQDNFLFSDTLERNIAFGVDLEKVDKEEVTNAARAACIHDSIMEFPQSYETVVGERGVTLSGGQKQRSSIARALIKDAPILIMDDSLSAVDTDTEEHILENLRRIREGKTTILIAHRITTIQNADMIMVLEDGEMVECGNHQDLMAKNGVYKTMFEKQQLEAMKAAKEGEGA